MRVPFQEEKFSFLSRKSQSPYNIVSWDQQIGAALPPNPGNTIFLPCSLPYL